MQATGYAQVRFADASVSFADPPQRREFQGPPEQLSSTVECQLQVGISVDRNGKVTSAKVDRARTTCRDTALLRKAEEHARQYRFSKAPHAPAAQQGFVRYDFFKVMDPPGWAPDPHHGYPERVARERNVRDETTEGEDAIPSPEPEPAVPEEHYPEPRPARPAAPLPAPSKSPAFAGGFDAWLSFVRANIQYIPAPAWFISSGYQVLVELTVDSTGTLIDAQVVDPGRSPEHEAEALRVCRLPRQWEPGMKNGKAITATMKTWMIFPTQPKHPVSVEFVNGKERLLYIFPRLSSLLTKPTPCTMAFLLTVDRTGKVTEVQEDKRCDCTNASDLAEARGIASRYRFEPLSDGPKEQTVRISWSTAITPEEEEAKVYDLATVDEKPQFPGGEAAMAAYLADSLQYPEAERARGINGRVRVGFQVASDGTVRYVSAWDGPLQVTSPMFREAERVVRSMPRWTPGKLNGRAVNVHMVVSVEFKLEP